MHKAIKKALEKAEGVSEFVIAVNVDIRGFSEFSRRVESPDAAVYIKKVYLRLVNEYLTGASWFKPTGDGLLLTFPYKENNLKQVFSDIISKCIKVEKDFHKICDNDPMINFKVPKYIGIGISRGTACRIKSGTKIIDYSGHVLNLTSRLMDIARPRGIVFHDDFGPELLPENSCEIFSKTKVYLKGIAEEKPIPVYYTKGITKISAIHKSPLNDISWEKFTIEEKVSAMIKKGNFWHPLPTRPSDPDEILVEVVHPKVLKGKKVSGVGTFHRPEFTYRASGGEYFVIVDMNEIAERAKKKGVKDNWLIEFNIKYPVKKSKSRKVSN